MRRGSEGRSKGRYSGRREGIDGRGEKVDERREIMVSSLHWKDEQFNTISYLQLF